MIPLRLSLKNFMCYRENVPTLELEGIHLACLCGDNGHGKSALLDAITWALWGEARTKTQEELIHQGRTDMSVELEFMARDQRYQVSRRHSRSGKSRQGTTLLDLAVQSNGGFRSIAGSVRETEARIKELLHMDRQTFVNSAFLLQGRADMFTTSPPVERKRILGEILDLSYYSRLEDRAKERIRRIEEGAEGAPGIRGTTLRIEALDREIVSRTDIEAQLTESRAEFEELGPRIAQEQNAVEALRRSLDQLRDKERELTEVGHRLEAVEEELKGFQDQAQGHRQRIASYEGLLERRLEIEEGFQGLQQARQSLEQMNEASIRYSELSKERGVLAETVVRERERLSGEIRQEEARITQELEPKSGLLPKLADEVAQAELLLKELEGVEASLKETEGRVQSLEADIQRLKMTREQLLQGMQELRTKFDLLAEEEAQCPVCNKPLGPEDKDHLRDEYEAQGKAKKEAYQENEAMLAALEKEHSTLSKQLGDDKRGLEQRRTSAQSGLITLQRDLQEAQQAAERLSESRARLKELQERLSQGDYARGEQEALERLDAQLSTLGYDPAGRRQAQEQAQALENFAELHRRLAEGTEALPAEKASLERLEQAIQRRQEELSEHRRRKEALAEEAKGIPALGTQLRDAEAGYKSLYDNMVECRAREKTLEGRLEELALRERELEREKERLKELQRDKSLYDELAVAFGKNGIQALIIESTVPQIEDEANELLAMLTDNLMTLKLETQRERRTQKGEPIETLEIKIADDLGTRSYETFSGGEAFRINFALRIALSKLLARRAGAPLPTLFIDEGFGSQDNAGRERLLQAIKAIEKDFQKIIVITHIEELKEAFPVRIEVTKTEAGATFTVI